jgi:hypothetical protein
MAAHSTDDHLELYALNRLEETAAAPGDRPCQGKKSKQPQHGSNFDEAQSTRSSGDLEKLQWQELGRVATVSEAESRSLRNASTHRQVFRVLHRRRPACDQDCAVRSITDYGARFGFSMPY